MFVPMKRTALDGKEWWCVYDTEKHMFSTLLFFGKYKRKKDCQYAIDNAKRKYNIKKLYGRIKKYE